MRPIISSFAQSKCSIRTAVNGQQLSVLLNHLPSDELKKLRKVLFTPTILVVTDRSNNNMSMVDYLVHLHT